MATWGNGREGGREEIFSYGGRVSFFPKALGGLEGADEGGGPARLGIIKMK